MPAPFSRYLLRTTDVAAATAFYDAVLESRGDGIVALHEDAIARGARPHWLGHVRARDLGGSEALATRFIERGATRLGPPPGRGDFVVLRDPGGALVGLTDSEADSAASVVWHQLSTLNPDQAAENYGALCGWSLSAPFELGQLGQHRRLGYAKGDASVGLVSGVEGRPQVHPHWLFFFAVPSLEAAALRVRELGGVVIGPIELPSGGRVAVCDDPQGAAFGLIEPDDAAKLARR